MTPEQAKEWCADLRSMADWVEEHPHMFKRWATVELHAGTYESEAEFEAAFKELDSAHVDTTGDPARYFGDHYIYIHINPENTRQGMIKEYALMRKETAS